MATYTFNGQNQTINGFVPATDSVFFDNVNVINIRAIEEVGSNVVITLTNGNSLTLTNQSFATLSTSQVGTGLRAGSGSDVNFAFGNSGANVTLTGNAVAASAGNDSITGSGTVGSILYGNTGDDTVDGAGAFGARLYGGQGNDSIVNIGLGSVVYGGLNDALSATPNDVIDASGAGGSVTIFGGNGQADSADGADNITGGTFADVLYGNAGNDTIFGGGLAVQTDVIYGGAGNDSVDGSGVIYGGVGADSINATFAATVYGGNGQLDAADGADSITGSADNQLIYGNGGNDTISGGGGLDSIFGGAGNDSITASLTTGAVVYGGNDADTLAITGTGAAVTIFGGNGSSDAGDLADTITFTGTGTSVIYGNGGNDVITGGAQNDTVFGGAGNDSINVGLGGNDALTGGVGLDTITFAAGASVATDLTIDTINGLNFDQDEIRFTGAAPITSFQSVTVASAATVADAANATVTAAGQISLITVTAGAAAGTYIESENGFVRLVGATGTFDLDAFQ